MHEVCSVTYAAVRAAVACNTEKPWNSELCGSCTGMQSGGMDQAPVFDLDSRRTVKNDSGAFIGVIIEASAVLDRCTVHASGRLRCDTHHSCLRY
jgi:hypothetical protein